MLGANADVEALCGVAIWMDSFRAITTGQNELTHEGA